MNEILSKYKVHQSVAAFALSAIALAMAGCDSGASSGYTGGGAPSAQVGGGLPANLDGSEPVPQQVSFAAPAALAVTEMVLYDAEGYPIKDADVEVASAGAASASTLDPDVVLAQSGVKSDANGKFTLPQSLSPGVFSLTATKYGISVKSKFKVLPGNANAVAAAAVAATQSGTSLTKLEDNVLLVAVSGKVYGAEGPIKNAQVSLSGGPATNGVFRVAQTDDLGQFNLTYAFKNPSNDLTEALAKTQVSAWAPGFQENFVYLDTTDGNVSGANVGLNKASESQQVFWQETFEATSKTVDQWQVEGGYSFNDAETTWNLLSKGHEIVNQLWGTHVKPGIGETSDGKLPDPFEGERAYWFGNKTYGNFIGRLATSGTEKPMDGGESMHPLDGALVSPKIQLPNVSPLSLTFMTWWEIESVNPNQNGFDWMEVQVSVDGEKYHTLARLNPIADPVTSDRYALPFSSGGFNQAPRWVYQAPISLEDYRGQTVQLRFRFDTRDGLFNGFRGWMIDDVAVRQVQAMHPPFKYFSWEDYDAEWSSDSIMPSSVDQPQSLPSSKTHAVFGPAVRD